MNPYRDARRVAAAVLAGAVLIGAGVGYVFTDFLMHRHRQER